MSLTGLPVLAVEYADVVADPGGWVRQLVDFLSDNGITPGANRLEQATQVLTGDLRHHRARSVRRTLESEQQPLLDLLRASLGVHDQWSTPELPEEPSWVEDVISLTLAGQEVTAAMQVAQHELRWVKKSRLFAPRAPSGGSPEQGPPSAPLLTSRNAARTTLNGASAAAPAASR